MKPIEGILTLVLNILTFGSGTAAKMGLKTAVESAGKQGINIAKNALKAVFYGQFRRRILRKAKNTLRVKIKDNLKEFVEGKFIYLALKTAVENIYVIVWDKVMKSTNTDQLEKVDESFTNKLEDTLDFFDIGVITKTCSSDVSQDKGIYCAKSIVESLSTFDPTGIMTIASAFMHPSCDVPETTSQFESVLEEKDLPSN